MHVAANEAYEHWRATGRDTLGRRLKGNSKPCVPPGLPDAVIADAGYWHSVQMQAITERGIEVLVPTDGKRRKLSAERGRELYAQRKISVEPVYGQIKYNRHIDRFMRRGRAAADAPVRDTVPRNHHADRIPTLSAYSDSLATTGLPE